MMMRSVCLTDDDFIILNDFCACRSWVGVGGLRAALSQWRCRLHPQQSCTEEAGVLDSCSASSSPLRWTLNHRWATGPKWFCSHPNTAGREPVHNERYHRHTRKARRSWDWTGAEETQYHSRGRQGTRQFGSISAIHGKVSIVTHLSLNLWLTLNSWI